MHDPRSSTLRPTTLRSLLAQVSALGLIFGLLGCGGQSTDDPFGAVLVDNNQALEESSGDAADETVTFLLAETSDAPASEVTPCPVGNDPEEDGLDDEESLSDDDEESLSDDDESDDDESDDDESDDDEESLSDDDESDDDEESLSDDDESDDDNVAPCEPAPAPEPPPIL